VEEQAAALAELRRQAEPFRLRARAAEEERDEQRARAEVRPGPRRGAATYEVCFDCELYFSEDGVQVCFQPLRV